MNFQTVIDFLAPVMSAVLVGWCVYRISKQHYEGLLREKDEENRPSVIDGPVAANGTVRGDVAMLALHRMYGIPLNVLRTMTTDERIRDLVTAFVEVVRPPINPTPEEISQMVAQLGTLWSHVPNRPTEFATPDMTQLTRDMAVTWERMTREQEERERRETIAKAIEEAAKQEPKPDPPSSWERIMGDE